MTPAQRDQLEQMCRQHVAMIDRMLDAVGVGSHVRAHDIALRVALRKYRHWYSQVAESIERDGDNFTVPPPIAQ